MKILIPPRTKETRNLPASQQLHATVKTAPDAVSHATAATVETTSNPVEKTADLRKPFVIPAASQQLHATGETISDPVLHATAQALHGTMTAPPAGSPIPRVLAEQNTMPTLLAVPAEVRAEAAERAKFIRLVNRIKAADASMTTPDACLRAAVNHADEFPILVRGGHGKRSQLTYNNYRNWTARLRDYRAAAKHPLSESEELEALASSYARGRRDPSGDPQFWRDFNTCYLNQNRPDITEARRAAVAALLSRDPNAVPPSISQVRYYVKHLPLDLVIRGREGDVAWEATSDYITRDWSMLLPGECLIGDSRTFDTRVCWQDEDGTWRKERPTVVMLMDARTWYPASWIITVKPVNHEVIMRCLAQYCVRNAGQPPALCYFDNGGDYCKTGFSTPFEVGGKKHSIFSELGIGLVNSIPYRARAKTVERFFRDMMKTYDKWFPDYLGSHPEERPDAAAYFDRPEHVKELPTLECFTRLFNMWTKEYVTRGKEGKIHGGKSPETLWQTLPHHKGRTFSDAELAFAFLLPVASRKVGRGPSVEFNRRHYFCDAVRYGETVLVKANLWDPDMVLLCREDGTAVGIARTRDAVWAIAGDNARQRELLDERLARQARLRRESREMLNELTGGRFGISMIEFMLTLGTDQRFAVRGQISTVKGKSHVYKRLAPAGDVFASSESDTSLIDEGNSSVSEREPDIESAQDKSLTDDTESRALAEQSTTEHTVGVFDFTAADNDDPEPPDLSLEIEDIAGVESDVSDEEIERLDALLNQ